MISGTVSCLIGAVFARLVEDGFGGVVWAEQTELSDKAARAVASRAEEARMGGV
jgi:hypothetical protein